MGVTVAKVDNATSDPQSQHDGERVFGGLPLDELPHLVLENIVKHLPAHSLFVIMSVSLKWKAAAEWEVKHRDHLSVHRLVRCKDCFQKPDPCILCRKQRISKNGSIGISDKGDHHAIKSLQKFKGLKRLQVHEASPLPVALIMFGNYESLVTVTGIYCPPIGEWEPQPRFPNLTYLTCHFLPEHSAEICPQLQDLTVDESITSSNHIPVTNILPEKTILKNLRRFRLRWKTGANKSAEFIRRHSPYLEELDINFDLPLKAGIFYPQLKTLQTDWSVVSRRAVTMCPRLQSLNLTLTTVHVLTALPVAMQEIQFRVERKKLPAGQSMTAVLQALNRLTELKVLRLEILDSSLSESEFNTFTTALDDMSILEDLVLKMKSASLPTSKADKMVQRLVEKNTCLRKLVLHGMPLTVAAIVAAKRLPHLLSLGLESEPPAITHEHKECSGSSVS